MFIVEKDAGMTIVAVSERINTPWPDPACTIHSLPKWDWSLADLTGVDKTQPDWIGTQLMWNGTTLVKKVP
jgi:hypothetical protein